MKKYAVYFLLGLVLIFTMQNYQAVDIRFLFWSRELSASILIFLVLLVGVLVGYLLHFLGRDD